ncbi:MAG: hypothetical protein HC926_03145 [Synechococcaceae cyanobacterium SM2_3_60]|nr:hypothetical protein [Synechococcaceae cyanobacterium SM2_3_60]
MALALRVAYVLHHKPHEHVYSDMFNYVSKAQYLANGGLETKEHTFHPPGQQHFLAFFHFLFEYADAPIQGFYVLLSLLTVVLVIWVLASF